MVLFKHWLQPGLEIYPFAIKAKQLILNYNKANYLQFNTKNSWDYEVKPNYQGNHQKLIKYKSFRIDYQWLSIMEGSYRPNYVKIEYSMLCNSKNTSYNVFRNLENGLFCIHTFSHKLQDNFWGEINHIVTRFSKSKKGWLESLQVQEQEIHVGNCSKN